MYDMLGKKEQGIKNKLKFPPKKRDQKNEKTRKTKLLV
jgi:hypothetical protein